MEGHKLLIISDSHGNTSNPKKAIEKEKPFEMLIHCGDIEGPISTITGDNPDYEVKIVRGNCDFGNQYPTDEEFRVGPYNIWVNHGNGYNVKYDEKLEALKREAVKRYADIVFFGHSHYAEIVKDDDAGITFVNPGMIGDPRISSGESTYAVVTVTDDYDIIAELKKI